MMLTAEDRADVARIVKESFASRSPALCALLDRVARIEAENPGMCKIGVPATHPLGPVDDRYAIPVGFVSRRFPVAEEHN